MPLTARSPRRVALGVVALSSVAVLTACGSSTNHSEMPGMSASSGMGASSSPSGSAADVMFAQMMIPHHEQAVEMADLALADRAGASVEVRRLATSIKAAQDPEIKTMQGWLSSWGAPTAPAMDHGMPGMMGETDMAALEAATGDSFDKQWLTMMIAHHQGAVTMAQDVMGTTSDPAVRTLAEAIIQGQEQEIATMKGLLG